MQEPPKRKSTQSALPFQPVEKKLKVADSENFLTVDAFEIRFGFISEKPHWKLSLQLFKEFTILYGYISPIEYTKDSIFRDQNFVLIQQTLRFYDDLLSNVLDSLFPPTTTGHPPSTPTEPAILNRSSSARGNINPTNRHDHHNGTINFNNDLEHSATPGESKLIFGEYTPQLVVQWVNSARWVDVIIDQHSAAEMNNLSGGDSFTLSRGYNNSQPRLSSSGNIYNSTNHNNNYNNYTNNTPLDDEYVVDDDFASEDLQKESMSSQHNSYNNYNRPSSSTSQRTASRNSILSESGITVDNITPTYLRTIFNNPLSPPSSSSQTFPTPPNPKTTTAHSSSSHHNNTKNQHRPPRARSQSAPKSRRGAAPPPSSSTTKTKPQSSSTRITHQQGFNGLHDLPDIAPIGVVPISKIPHKETITRKTAPKRT